MVCLQHWYTQQCRIRSNSNNNKKGTKNQKIYNDLSVEKMACSPPPLDENEQQQHQPPLSSITKGRGIIWGIIWQHGHLLKLLSYQDKRKLINHLMLFPRPTGFFTHALIMSVATHTHLLFTLFPNLIGCETYCFPAPALWHCDWRELGAWETVC